VDVVDDQFGTLLSGYSLPDGQSASFTYVTLIYDDVTNVANATGDYGFGNVSDTDSASVNVQASVVGGEILPINMLKSLSPYFLLFVLIVSTVIIVYKKKVTG
jgi:hypothetical protein